MKSGQKRQQVPITTSTRNCSTHKVGNSFRIFPGPELSLPETQRGDGHQCTVVAKPHCSNGSICARVFLRATDLPPAEPLSLSCDTGLAGCHDRRECSAIRSTPSGSIGAAVTPTKQTSTLRNSDSMPGCENWPRAAELSGGCRCQTCLRRWLWQIL